jgi:hypothetical protein
MAQSLPFSSPTGAHALSLSFPPGRQLLPVLPPARKPLAPPPLLHPLHPPLLSLAATYRVTACSPRLLAFVLPPISAMSDQAL